MLEAYPVHNRFRHSLAEFQELDPHLKSLSQLKYQHSSNWWQQLDFDTAGIYILTGGRQVGKSTSTKLLINHCLKNQIFSSGQVFYLPCDEIYDAKELSETIRYFLEAAQAQKFLLIIDEITFVRNWDRVIKAIADEGYFNQGLCLLTGSDTLILKEAAMRFPGRRGQAAKIDFHLYPLSFAEYVKLVKPEAVSDNTNLANLFQNYLSSGGYLRAINDLAKNKHITESTFLTYEQWIRGDFLKQGKNEEYLLAILRALLTVGTSQISYSSLTQKIGLISKETCIDYCRLLERMDILINLQAFDQNKKQGFPKKARKFHFSDPFIQNNIYHWLKREGYLNSLNMESCAVEATVASHCHRIGKVYYFKGQGEIDVIRMKNSKPQAIEVKWSEQLRPADLKMLENFNDSLVLTKSNKQGVINKITCMPVYKFLLDMS